MLEIILIVILLLYSIVATIGIIRGMKKTEFYESQFEQIKIKVNDTYLQMKEVDTLGAFEADDDVGNTFKDLKDLVEDLNRYTTENISETENA